MQGGRRFIKSRVTVTDRLLPLCGIHRGSSNSSIWIWSQKSFPINFHDNNNYYSLGIWIFLSLLLHIECCNCQGKRGGGVSWLSFLHEFFISRNVWKSFVVMRSLEISVTKKMPRRARGNNPECRRDIKHYKKKAWDIHLSLLPFRSDRWWVANPDRNRWTSTRCLRVGIPLAPRWTSARKIFIIIIIDFWQWLWKFEG